MTRNERIGCRFRSLIVSHVNICVTYTTIQDVKHNILGSYFVSRYINPLQFFRTVCSERQGFRSVYLQSFSSPVVEIIRRGQRNERMKVCVLTLTELNGLSA